MLRHAGCCGKAPCCYYCRLPCSWSCSMSARSSSPRRSSRSTTPFWRMSVGQKPATGISLVYGQPEHASPLRSAMDHLPLLAHSDTASIMTQDKTTFQTNGFESPTSAVRPRVEEAEDEDRTRKRSRVDSLASGSDEHDVNVPLEADVPVTEGTGKAQAPSPPPHDSQPVSSPEISIQTPAQPVTQTQTVELADAGVKRATISYKPSCLSWFGSRPRTNATEVLMKATDDIVPAASDTPLVVQRSNTSPLQNIVETQSPLPTVDTTTPHNTVTAGSQFQASPTSIQTESAVYPESVRQLYIQTTQKPQARPMEPMPSTRTVTSVDDEVPGPKPSSLSSTPSEALPVLVQSEDEGERGRKLAIASLNPSSSRFTLRLPLLGRPKVPLEQIAVVAQAGESAGPRESEPVPDASGRDTDAQPSVTSLALVDGSLSVEPSTSATQELSSVVSASNSPVEAVASQEPSSSADVNINEVSANPTPASSWWDYVGWGRSQPVQADQPDPKPEQTTTGGDINIIATDTSTHVFPKVPFSPSTSQTPMTPTPLGSLSATTQSAEITKASSLREAVQRREEALPGKPTPSEQEPASAFPEPVKSERSTWYSPWAWYATSPVSPPYDSALSGATATGATANSESGETAKMESEVVKTQALARDHPAPTVVAESSRAPPQVDPPPVEPKNPIESSVSTHRSGWATFFMSRALVTKSVSDEQKDRDENGMEIMNLDEDGDAPKAPSDPIIIAPAKPVQQLTSLSPKASSSAFVKDKVRKSETSPLSDKNTREALKPKTPRSISPTPSKAPSVSSTAPRPPNLVLPGFEEIFHLPPRSTFIPISKAGKSKLSQTLSFVSGALFSKEESAQGKGKGKDKGNPFLHFGKELPKALDVVGEQLNSYIMSGGCRVVVIGVAGWMPGAVTRTIAGGLPSSSTKFVNMTCQALERFEQQHGFKFKKITKMPLEGDGTIERKVSKVHQHLLSNDEWMEDLHAADVIFVATHSQGSIVSTHLIDMLIQDGHILTTRSVDILTETAATIAPGGAASLSATQAQRVCFLALSGIHLGPLRYLKMSSLLQPYIQYFENSSASELFEFQNTESPLSKAYTKALSNILDHGTKVVFIASLNDQVVPIYSGLFSAASHPRILRALYIDGDAYHTTDFLTNLLILLVRIMNAGLSDGGLLAHLSEATAGSLSGIGHSTVYEEPETFSLAVNYFFLANDGDSPASLSVQPFDAVVEQNDYEIPWSLRDMIADERVAYFFAHEFAQLRDTFDDWQPKTTILRDVKRKLQPIQRLSAIVSHTTSKL